MMKKDKNLEIELAVFRRLEEILEIPREQLKLTDDLVNDLGLVSEELSIDFAVELEKELGIEPPLKEYSKVFTIEDAINLFKTYNKD